MKLVGWLLVTSLLAAPAALADSVPVPPSAPTGLVAFARVDGPVDLSWEAPVEDGGSLILEYRIYRSEEAAEPILVGVASTTSFVDQSVPVTVSSVDFEYFVTAVSMAGESSRSDATQPMSLNSCLYFWIDLPPGVNVDLRCANVCPYLPPNPVCSFRPPFTDW